MHIVWIQLAGPHGRSKTLWGLEEDEAAAVSATLDTCGHSDREPPVAACGRHIAAHHDGLALVAASRWTGHAYARLRRRCGYRNVLVAKRGRDSDVCIRIRAGTCTWRKGVCPHGHDEFKAPRRDYQRHTTPCTDQPGLAVMECSLVFSHSQK
jgi:hypothetical protein